MVHILKCLLLQIREDQQVRQEELDSFLLYSGLPKGSLDVLNVFDTPHFSAQVVLPYTAIFVGGASEASVLEPERYPFVQDAQALLRYCVDIGKPVFASCFGFQLAVLALGGDIVRDTGSFEMGTLLISLTAAARDDALMGFLSEGFLAVSVHREKATRLPTECTLLAYTALCCHAFRVAEKPFWAFQFHPEVDRKTLVQRLTVYKAHYTQGDAQLDDIIRSAQETPEANVLLRRFVTLLP